ncbi:N-acetylglucosamine-6-phosphate deacetylase [Proteiniborus sp. MB09-C3]|uniref:N-acetylglucosamine-6-phosphate deacetylase n=1 Tax=Proteiniborus sp. MB09-C3 TaxID=3050072 RepID=UPI002553AD42|nr:N-acetylglucosamine-6-phosphate deacetylase [Proteiniborus sp. MB09-C3]WIV11906.1 N-acetylglucosamine-6-phosphate deacetylase [Proteiniborus sp. MB09-C3]
MRYLIKSGEIFLKDRILNKGAILINNEIIEEVKTVNTYEDIEIIDLSNYKVLPGLIDTHIHGANGYDTMDANYASLNEISKYLGTIGVTGFLATTVTAPWDKITAAVKNIHETMKSGVEGAELLGAYIEGPFITEKYRGAHPSEYIRKIYIEDMKKLVDSFPSCIKTVTVAPDKENAIELIKYLKSQNINSSIGHTNATYDEALAAIEAGANIAVHVFNGMRGLHHREPGIVGAVLSDSRVCCELIADMTHVHPAVMKLIVKTKGSHNIGLITDCMMAGGMDDGEYMLGELKVFVEDGVARIENGSLAGSTLKLINAVKNMNEYVGVDLIEAVNMASLIPAQIAGVDHVQGSIEKGKKANFTVIDDNYNVVMTMVNGKIVYSSNTI